MKRYIASAAMLIAVMSLALFWSFTAEDAYIVGRYANNLTDTGEWVFNAGEYINALTSPLHGLIMAVLSLVGDPIELWQYAGVALTIAVLWWGYQSISTSSRRLIWLTLVVAAPPIWLWATGGLETPLLLAWIVMLCVWQSQTMTPQRFMLICGVSALAVLTRYDAVLFCAPVVLDASWRLKKWRWVGAGYLLGGVIVGAWLLFAWQYYHDIFPTSFYAKAPGGFQVESIAYVISYLVIIGVIPLALLLWQSSNRLPRSTSLVVGVAAIVLYSFTMATHHMMFGLRSLVPYLPVMAWLISDMHSDNKMKHLPQRSLGVLCAGILTIHAAHAVYMYETSINGLTPFGEYQQVSVREYVQFIDVLEDQAGEIASHWRDAGNEQPPTIMTYAAGVIPYYVPDAYIIDKMPGTQSLISYRHAGCSVPLNAADYLVTLSSQHYVDIDDITIPETSYRLVRSHIVDFREKNEVFSLYYNLTPAKFEISSHIDDSC